MTVKDLRKFCSSSTTCAHRLPPGVLLQSRHEVSELLTSRVRRVVSVDGFQSFENRARCRQSEAVLELTKLEQQAIAVGPLLSERNQRRKVPAEPELW